MSLPPSEEVFGSRVFDCIIMPGEVPEDRVTFGIETNNPAFQSGHPRFTKLFFRTRRPIKEYKDFLELMASRHPNITLPPLPFEEALPDEDLDELDRKKDLLAAFFQELIAILDVFNDPYLPPFIQTRLSMVEIRRIIEEQEAAAANNINEQEVEENDPQVAADNDVQQVADNDPQVAADNDVQQVVADNDPQVAADNDVQQVVADNVQQAAANNQQVLQNRDGDNSSDGDSAKGNASGSETDEPIFRMEDI